MAKYEELRKDETRFGSYWEDNMKEITIKHIWLSTTLIFKFINALLSINIRSLTQFLTSLLY